MDTYKDYSRQCKDTQGGIRKVYLLPFVDYDETEIKNSGIELIDFPTSRVYEFEVEGNFSQQSSTQQGNVEFAPQAQILMSKIYNFYDVNVFVRNDWRVIVEDNNGNLIMLGTNNGLECNLSNASGDDKGVFNGFTLNFQGREELTGLYIDDFNDFFYTDPATGNIFNYTLNFEIL